MSLESEIEERLRETARKLADHEESLNDLKVRMKEFVNDAEAFFSGSNIETAAGTIDHAISQSMSNLGKCIAIRSEIVDQAICSIKNVT